jgi:hypothetical protein
MARRAGIRSFIFVGHRWRYERKRVCSNLNIRNSRRNFRHMAGNAAATRRPLLVMRVLFDGGRARTIQGKRAVAIQAELVRRFSQLSVVIRAVHIVATKAGHAAPVHHTLYKIIPLHAVLVRRAIRKMSESRLAQSVFFQPPKIPQV